MADKTELYKMNVRSPYFVVVTEEGKPSSIASDFDQDEDVDGGDQADEDGVYDDDNLPDIPDDFNIPKIDIQEVECGQTVNVSSDIGIRTYVIKDSEEKTGDFTLDYRVNVPVKFTSKHDGLGTQEDPGVTSIHFGKFKGNSAFVDELIESGGLLAGDTLPITDLVDGEANGSLTHTKSTATSKVEWIVNSPIQTDDYTLTFNCPASNIIPASDRTLPVTPPDNNAIVMNVLAFYYQANYNFDSGGVDNTNSNISIEINGTEVVASMNYDEVYIVSDQSQLGDIEYPAWIGNRRVNTTKTTNYISRGTHMKKGQNQIKLIGNSDAYGSVGFARLGIYHDGTSYKFTKVNDENRFPFEAAPLGQNSFIHYGGVGFTKGQTNTARLGWYEPADGTHAYLNNDAAQFPWYLSDAIKTSYRSVSRSPVAGVVNYAFIDVITGKGTVRGDFLGTFNNNSN